MWGNTNKHNAFTEGDGAAGTEIDLSACTAAPSGLPSVQANSFSICASAQNLALASRKVADELQAVFDVRGASGVAVDVRPWVYLPEFRRDATGEVGIWKALRLLAGIPLDAETTDDKGTIYRIPVPAGATHMYLQGHAETGSPTSTEAAVYSTEELE